MPDGGVNFPIYATDEGASEIVDQLLARIQGLGAGGADAFLELDTAAQQSLLKFIQLDTQWQIAAASALGLTTNMTQLKDQLASVNALMSGTSASAYSETLQQQYEAVTQLEQAESARVESLTAMRQAEGFGATATENAIAMVQEYTIALNEAAAAEDRFTAAAMAAGAASMAQHGGMAPVAIPPQGPQGYEAFGTNEYQAAWQAAAMGSQGATQAALTTAQQLDATGEVWMRAGTRARQAGMNITTGLTLPIALLGGAALVNASSFQTAMMQIYSQAGASMQEVQSMSKAVLDIQGAAQGPVALSRALFEIESVGLRGTTALDTLKAASKGATTGQADLTTTTTALTAAMNSQIKGAENANTAMATINATVGVGRIHMQDYASALSSGILPVAKQFGVSLTDIGAAIDVMTNAGMQADQASTRLRTSLTLIAAPTAAAQKEFAKIGLGQLDLANTMRGPDGLVGAIDLLKQHLDAYTNDPSVQADIIARAFGGGRTSSAIITLVQGFDEFRSVQQGIVKDAGQFDAQYAAMLDTFGVRWHQFIASVQRDAIELGNALMPSVEAFFTAAEPVIADLTKLFTAMPAPLQDVIAGFLLLTALSGPLLIVGGAMSSIFGAALKVESMILRLNGAVATFVEEAGAGTGASGAFSAALDRLSLSGDAAAAGVEAAGGAEVTGAAGGAAGAGIAGTGIAAGSLLGPIAAITAGLLVYDTVSRVIGGGGLKDVFTGDKLSADAAAASVQKYSQELQKMNEAIKSGMSQDAAKQFFSNEASKNAVDNLAKVQIAMDSLNKTKQNILSEPFGSAGMIGTSGLGFELGAAALRTITLGKIDLSPLDHAKAQVAADMAAINTSVDQIRQMGLSSADLSKLMVQYPDLGKSEAFNKLLGDTERAEMAAATATQQERLALDGQNQALSTSGSAFDDLITRLDKYKQAATDANKLFTELNPQVAAIQAQIDALKALQNQVDQNGDAYKSYGTKINELNNVLDQLNGTAKIQQSIITSYTAALQATWTPPPPNQFGPVQDSADAAADSAKRLAQTLQNMPQSDLIKIALLLPDLEMNRLKTFLEWLENLQQQGVQIDVAINEALNAATLTPQQMDLSNKTFLGGSIANLPGAADVVNQSHQDAIDQALRDINFKNSQTPPPAPGSGSGSGGSGGSKPTQADQNLLAVAAAFQKFEQQFGSTSIPAFQSYLQMEQKLTAAEEQHTAVLEQQQNPLLAMTMALGAIRTHILEANESIEQFLRNEVFMPALNNFKSALDQLFSRPNRETATLQLQLDQLQLQKLEAQRRGASSAELKQMDNNINAIQREIDIRNKVNDIYKDQAVLADKTTQSQADVLQQAQLLTRAISTTSGEVNSLNTAVFFQALAAINAGNALNLAADAARAFANGSGGSVGGAAVGGPVSGWTTINEAGRELVRLPSGSYVYPATQTKQMLGSQTSMQFNLTIQPGKSNDQMRAEIMSWIDNALFRASYGGAVVNSATYSPNG